MLRRRSYRSARPRGPLRVPRQPQKAGARRQIEGASSQPFPKAKAFEKGVGISHPGVTFRDDRCAPLAAPHHARPPALPCERYIGWWLRVCYVSELLMTWPVWHVYFTYSAVIAGTRWLWVSGSIYRSRRSGYLEPWESRCGPHKLYRLGQLFAF